MKKIIKVFSLLVISLSLTNNGIAIEAAASRDDLPIFIDKNDAIAHINKINTNNPEFNNMKKMVNSKDTYNSRELEKITNLYYKLCVKYIGACDDETDDLLNNLSEEDFEDVDIDEMVSGFGGSEQENTETTSNQPYKTEDTDTDEESTNDTTDETEENSTDDDKNIEGKEKLYNALSGASTAAMGVGAMEAAQALSEKKQDAAAETDMTAYLATMRCDYGRGNTYKLGEEEIDVGGGNELINYVTEYKTLASRLQKTKTALKMTPGIESEKILDKAESNLYTYAPPQKVQSTFGSLANALRDENSEDAQKWAEQKDKTQKRLIVGASVAAAGLVTAVTTNLTLGKKLRDAKRAEQDNTGIGDAKIFDDND